MVLQFHKTLVEILISYLAHKSLLTPLCFAIIPQASTSTLTPHSVSADGGMNLNELNVTVRCCSNLTSRHAHPPSPYVVYQFYDFPDHDTCIVGDCSEPQFEDNMSFPVAMEAELDSYLKAGALLLYVFDDHDTQSEMYLGKARVPLLSLAHDKAITG